MKVETNLQVADARDAYLRWNAQQYKKMSETLGDELSRFIKLIPLFFQINHKLLPGYTNLSSPVGVYAYKPEKNILDDAVMLNNKFRYQQEGIVKNTDIDAIFFQRKLIDESSCCWVFHRAGLNKEQVAELKQKTNKVSQWFSHRGHRLDFVCLSVNDVNNHTEQTGFINKSIFLDCFYSEVVLLAGKYPVWWLVPPIKENEYHAFVEHIKQARFVDNEEFMDLGSTLELKRSDLVKYAVEQVQTVKQSPEICLVDLLLIDIKILAWPSAEGVSYRLKNMLYQQKEIIDPVEIASQMLHESFSFIPADSHVVKPVKLFSSLKNVSGKLSHKIIDAFIGQSYQQQVSAVGIEKIISVLNLFKALTHEIRQIFSNIVASYSEGTEFNEADQSLISVARNMMVFLSENSDSVPLYNNKDKSDIILDRILLRHKIISDVDERWNLVLETSEGQEKVIEGFNSLLGLLAWCWLNRLVNHSTQVSIDCPLQQVKQTEARYVLEVLMQQLNPALISIIPAEAFENPVRPLQSFLFINFSTINDHKNIKMTANDDPLSFGVDSMNLVTHCEQLIVNSWGDVYTKLYTGDSGIIQCLCEWTHHTPLDGLARPQQIIVFGHGTGDSTYMAQRVDQVYKEMLEFFYNARQDPGRFILRLSGDYYVIVAENALLKQHKIGDRRLLLEYLSAPVESYQKTAVERLAYAEYPFTEIYRENKENVLQIFFQLINRECHTWVLDEKGSLCQDISEMFERESYITHWLYTYRNLVNRMKKIHVQGYEPPGLEINQISINQLGGIEFYTLGADTISGKKNFLDLQVSIETEGNLDHLSLVCDGRFFDYEKLEQSVLIECVQYLSARITTEGRQPVYVTDIDVPLRLFNVTKREEIQMSHMLKIKRNFEHRINKLLED